MQSDALQAAASRLKATDTIVTHRDGSRTLERQGNQVGTLPPPDVLPPALQERKRMCIAPPEPPSWTLPPFATFQLPPPAGASLRVVTWNVWFGPVEAQARMAALFSEALGTTPDVICLQEVVPDLAASIRGCSALRRAYAISANDVGSYGCLILARHELSPRFTEVPYQCSRMGRSLLVAELSPPADPAPPAACRVAVATTHLESLNNARLRAKQLRIARDTLASYDSAALVGDFNFDSSQNFGDWLPRGDRRTMPPRPERESSDSDSEPRPPWAPPSALRRAELENGVLDLVMGDYIDAWPALRPHEAGHTFDGGSNPHVADVEERMRYDRVMVRGIAPAAITMLGERPQEALVPSDHYGLCAELRLRPE